MMSRMAEIVNISDARRTKELTADLAWERFVAAQERSKQTLDINDGIAAAKAYADFLDLFVWKRR